MLVATNTLTFGYQCASIANRPPSHVEKPPCKRAKRNADEDVSTVDDNCSGIAVKNENKTDFFEGADTVGKENTYLGVNPTITKSQVMREIAGLDNDGHFRKGEEKIIGLNSEKR